MQSVENEEFGYWRRVVNKAGLSYLWLACVEEGTEWGAIMCAVYNPPPALPRFRGTGELIQAFFFLCEEDTKIIPIT